MNEESNNSKWRVDRFMDHSRRSEVFAITDDTGTECFRGNAEQVAGHLVFQMQKRQKENTQQQELNSEIREVFWQCIHAIEQLMNWSNLHKDEQARLDEIDAHRAMTSARELIDVPQSYGGIG